MTINEGESTFDSAAGNTANKDDEGKLVDKLVTLRNKQHNDLTFEVSQLVNLISYKITIDYSHCNFSSTPLHCK